MDILLIYIFLIHKLRDIVLIESKLIAVCCEYFALDNKLGSHSNSIILLVATSFEKHEINEEDCAK